MPFPVMPKAARLSLIFSRIAFSFLAISSRNCPCKIVNSFCRVPSRSIPVRPKRTSSRSGFFFTSNSSTRVSTSTDPFSFLSASISSNSLAASSWLVMSPKYLRTTALTLFSISLMAMVFLSSPPTTRSFVFSIASSIALFISAMSLLPSCLSFRCLSQPRLRPCLGSRTKVYGVGIFLIIVLRAIFYNQAFF